MVFFNGRGRIDIPFLQTAIEVEFADMTVNTDKIVYSAKKIRAINEATELLERLFHQEKDTLINPESVQELNDFVIRNERFTSNLQDSVPMALPLALKKEVHGVDYSIILTNIDFQPGSASLNALMLVEDAVTGQPLTFGSKGICLHPYGVGYTGIAELALLEDFEFDGSGDLPIKYKAPKQKQVGTFARFDCQGFIDLHLEAIVPFPGNMLKPASPEENIVSGHISANTQEWGQFISDIVIDDFVMPGLEGYTFKVEKALIDFSDHEYPEGIKFRASSSTTGQDWKGIFLQEVKIQLPEAIQGPNGAVFCASSGWSIDLTGLSGEVKESDLLPLEQGRLGNWPTAVDLLQLNIESNSLLEGKLEGQVQVPLLEKGDALKYKALVNAAQTDSLLLLRLQPGEKLEIDAWKTNVRLDGTSFLEVQRDSLEWLPSLVLNGTMTVHHQVDEESIFDVDALAFEGLKINTDGQLSLEAFALYGNSGKRIQENLHGFPILIKDIVVESDQDKEMRLGFDVDLLLSQADIGISGNTSLTFVGATTRSSKAWIFEDFKVQPLALQADLGALQLDGQLSIFQQDKIYGTGFNGIVQTTFPGGLGAIPSVAQFGNANGVPYFYIDSKSVNEAPEAKLFGLDLYGFQGGLTYNIRKEGQNTSLFLKASELPVDGFQPGFKLSDSKFIPHAGESLVMQADLILGLHHVAALSADLSWIMNFGEPSNGSIPMKALSVQGEAYFLTESLEKRRKSGLRAQINTFINFENGALLLNSPLLGKAGEEGSAELYFLPEEAPEVTLRMPNTKLSIGEERNNLSYQKEGSQWLLQRQLTQEQYDFEAQTIYGRGIFDAAFTAPVKRLLHTNCSDGYTELGLKGWYLNDWHIGYSRQDIGLRLNHSLFRGGLKFMELASPIDLQMDLAAAGLAKAHVHSHFPLLDGSVQGKIEYLLENGSICYAPEDIPGSMEIIAAIHPGEGAQEVSVEMNPQVDFLIDLREQFMLEQVDGEPVLFEPELTFLWEKEVAPRQRSFGELVPIDTTWQQVDSFQINYLDNGKSVELHSDKPLEPNTRYKVTVLVRWKYTDNQIQPISMWNYYQDEEGVVQEVRVVKFMTSDREEEQLLAETLTKKSPVIAEVPRRTKNGDFIAIAAKPTEDQIVLRWAPSNYSLWLKGMKEGYFVYRQEVGALAESTISLTGDQAILPWTTGQWNTVLPSTDPHIVFAAAVLSEKKPKNNPTGILQQYWQQHHNFSFALMSADRSADAATGLGLRLVDRNVEPGKTYRYYVQLAKSAQLPNPSSVDIQLGETETSAVVKDIRAVSADKIIRLEWPLEKEPF